jgi:acetoin utilization deacetylase AcuC-like enzyme
MSEVVLFHDEAMRDHDPGPLHPERAARLDAIREALERRPVAGVAWRRAGAASPEEVARVHLPAYVAEVDRARGLAVDLDPDTHLSEKSVDAAYLAAGAAGAAARLAMGGGPPSFALVRPPGHHAEHGRAMGFCVFNNVAVAAEAALGAGARRVLIVDWDVHHGNGTQHLFEGRRDVLVFNTHRFPFYPGTGGLRQVGRGEGEGYTINVPLPPGMGDGDYGAVFRDLLAPVAAGFQPDIVLISAGFDAHRDDPLGGMNVSAEGFASLCAEVKGVAAAHAGGRLALVLEGGYDLDGLATSVHACVEVLAGSTPPPPRAPGRPGQAALAEARAVQQAYWAL